MIQGNIWQTNDLVLYDNFLRLANLLILKIPSKIAVARVIPCWNCLHCLHCFSVCTAYTALIAGKTYTAATVPSYIAIWLEHFKTRSSSACHVGPLALETLIIFEQFWTHLNKFWTGWNTFDTFEQVLNPFEHIWTHLSKFWTSLNPFEHIWAGFEQVWTHLNTFEPIWTGFEQVWT